MGVSRLFPYPNTVPMGPKGPMGPMGPRLRNGPGINPPQRNKREPPIYIYIFFFFCFLRRLNQSVWTRAGWLGCWGLTINWKQRSGLWRHPQHAKHPTLMWMPDTKGFIYIYICMYTYIYIYIYIFINIYIYMCGCPKQMQVFEPE